MPIMLVRTDINFYILSMVNVINLHSIIFPNQYILGWTSMRYSRFIILETKNTAKHKTY